MKQTNLISSPYSSLTDVCCSYSDCSSSVDDKGENTAKTCIVPGRDRACVLLFAQYPILTFRLQTLECRFDLCGR